MPEPRTYVLYDDRAACGDTSEAFVLVVFESEEEAKTYKGDYGGMSCYSYKDDGDGMFIDERLEWNWYPS